MAKGETKKVNDQLNNQLNVENQNSKEAADSAKQRYNAMQGGYSSSPAYNGYGNMASGNNANIKGLSSIGATGAANPEALAALGGNGVYDDFAKTGGFNEGDLANIRARGTSNIPSMYGALKDQLTRANVSSGGYNPGFGSQLAKMTRQQGQAGQDAALNAELGIKSAVNTNKLAGASGLQTKGQAMNSASLAGYGGALSGETAGIAGMSQMEQAELDRILQSYGLQSSGANATLGTRAGLNPNTNWAGNIIGSVAGLGGALAGHV